MAEVERLKAIAEEHARQDPPRHEELHVTVEGDPLEWADFCRQFGYKPLYIELSNLSRQLMLAVSYQGAEEAQALADNVQDRGFRIVRIKHEVSALREGETPIYYETHVKLDGEMRPDRQGASRDLYRSNRWYMTRRAGAVQGQPPPFKAEAFVEQAARWAKQSTVVGVESEYCLLDTNPALDAGWL